MERVLFYKQVGKKEVQIPLAGISWIVYKVGLMLSYQYNN